MRGGQPPVPDAQGKDGGHYGKTARGKGEQAVGEKRPPVRAVTHIRKAGSQAVGHEEGRAGFFGQFRQVA